MENKTPVQIIATKNGPLQIKGKIKLIGIDGNDILSEGDIFLCRCGNSKNKPFCDDSHKKHGFKDR